MVAFSITVATHMHTSYSLKWFCATLFHCRYLLFAWKTYCGLKFHFSRIDQSNCCTKVSFTLPEIMWMQMMKLPYTKAKFYSKVKSQTSLSSLPVSWNVLLVVTRGLSKNTCEGVHLIKKLPAISLQTSKFNKNELLQTCFSRILARF